MQHISISNRPHPIHMTGLGFLPTMNESDTIGMVHTNWVNMFVMLFQSNVNDKVSALMESFLFANLKASYGVSITREVIMATKADFQRESADVITSGRSYGSVDDLGKAFAYSQAFLKAFSQVRTAKESSSQYYAELSNALAEQVADSLYELYGIICTVDEVEQKALSDILAESPSSTPSNTQAKDVSVFDKIFEINSQVFNEWDRAFAKSNFKLNNFVQNHILKYISNKAGVLVLSSILNTPFIDLAMKRYSLTDLDRAKKESWTSLDTISKYLLVFAIWKNRLATWKESQGFSASQRAYLKKLYNVISGNDLSESATIQDMIDKMVAVPLSTASQNETSGGSSGGSSGDSSGGSSSSSDDIDSSDEMDIPTSAESSTRQEKGATQLSKKDNTMVYVGLTAGAVVLGTIVGLAIKKAKKKKKAKTQGYGY